MTIQDALVAISSYPIPPATVQTICMARGVDAGADFTLALAKGANYKRAMADLCIWLSEAPNIVQGEVHFSFSPSERAYIRKKGAALLKETGEDLAGDQFGYMGDRL